MLTDYSKEVNDRWRSFNSCNLCGSTKDIESEHVCIRGAGLNYEFCAECLRTKPKECNQFLTDSINEFVKHQDEVRAQAGLPSFSYVAEPEVSRFWTWIRRFIGAE